MTTPDISVLIATRNRAGLLRDTLSAIERQEFGDCTYEVVVTDNGSSDETAAVLRHYAHRMPLVKLCEPKLGKSRALNRGLADASGDLLVFTDDDVLPERGWLKELYQGSKRWPDYAIFGGRVVPLYPPETPDWLKNHVITNAAFARFDPQVAEGPIGQLPFGPNFALRRAVLPDVRFSEVLGPKQAESYPMGCETELLSRLAAGGQGVIYVPRASVKHVIRSEQTTRQWLLHRAFCFGRGQRRAGHHQVADVMLLGVPRYLWRMLAEAWWRSARNLMSGTRRRIEAGWDLHFTRGVLYESFAMRSVSARGELQE